MNRKLIIILSICLYTAIIAFIFDNIGTQTIVRNGGTYQVSKRTSDGFKCRISYVDKESKESPKSQLMVGFESKSSTSCTAQDKVIEVTKSEALNLIQKRLNDPNYRYDGSLILTEN
jgi:hypothetical protein